MSGRLCGWHCPKALLFLFRLFNSTVWCSQLLSLSYRSGNWRTNRLGLFPKSPWQPMGSWRKSPAYPKSCHFSTRRYCAWAQGRRGSGAWASLSIMWVIGFFLAAWLYICTVICIRYPMHGCFPCYCWLGNHSCDGLVNAGDVFSLIQPSRVHGQCKPPVAFHHHTHTQLPCLPLQVQFRILFPRNPSLLTWTIGWVWEAEGKRDAFKWRGAERSLFPARGCAHSMQQ